LMQPAAPNQTLTTFPSRNRFQRCLLVNHFNPFFRRPAYPPPDLQMEISLGTFCYWPIIQHQLLTRTELPPAGPIG
jgi:hypothetical protein